NPAHARGKGQGAGYLRRACSLGPLPEAPRQARGIWLARARTRAQHLFQRAESAPRWRDPHAPKIIGLDQDLNAPQQFPFARQSAGPAPLRRPGSVRRTTSVDSDWPNGFGEPWIMTGRARDLMTPLDGSAAELARGDHTIEVSPQREILAIEIAPAHPRAGDMVGVRAGGASRTALAEVLGDLRGTPLFQVLDDFAGASLVAGWIWSRWTDDWHARMASSRAKAGAGSKGR